MARTYSPAPVPLRVQPRSPGLGSPTFAQSRDFNGDGSADLPIGVPLEDTGGRFFAGGLNVLYGSATGLQATGSGGPDDQLWSQDKPGVEGGAEGVDEWRGR